jgi:hypothetical protein
MLILICSCAIVDLVVMSLIHADGDLLRMVMRSPNTNCFVLSKLVIFGEMYSQIVLASSDISDANDRIVL